MEAIEFMKEVKRYCKITACKNCKISYACNWGVGYGEDADIVESVEFIKKWSIDNPIKTRQSEFLKMFPNAPLDGAGVLMIMPCELDKELDHGCVGCKYESAEGGCNRAYWSEEIE